MNLGPAETKPFSRSNLLVAVLIFFVAILFSYGNTISYPFQFDDFSNITQNPDILKTGTGNWEIKKILGGVRPVAKLSFAMNYALGGSRVEGYRLVNLLIHFANTCLIYLIFLRTLSLMKRKERLAGWAVSNEVVSGLGALLWALHPVQTEAVTYIVQRTASLATFFYLLSLFCYISGRLNEGRKSMIYLTFSLFTALLAFGTKENTLLLPLVIGLYEIYFINKWTFRFQKSELRLFGLLAVILVFGLLWVSMIHQGSAARFIYLIKADYGAGDLDPLKRMMTEWRVLFLYLSLLLFPLPGRMNLDYDFPVSQSLLDPMTTSFSLLGLLLLVGFAFSRVKRAPLLSFAILWFFVNLIVESTFIKLDLVFEHRLYLASIMFFLPAALALSSAGHWISKYNSRLPMIIGAVLLLSLMFLTFERNRVWRSEISLWSDVVSKSPGKPRGYTYLGAVLLQKGEFAEATQAFRTAVELDKDSPKAHFDLGVGYYNQGKNLEAIGEFQEAIRLRINTPEVYFSLGSIYLILNQNERAREAFKVYLESNPSNSEHISLSHARLGVIYSRKGNLEMAIESYKTAININKMDFKSYNDLGTIYQLSGKNALAIDEFRQAIQLNPRFPDPHFNLGTIYLEEGQNDLAILEFKQFLEMHYAVRSYNAMARSRLGILYIKKREIPSARYEFEQAVRIDPSCAFCRYNFGYFLEVMGMKNDALTQYQEALKYVDGQNMIKRELIEQRIHFPGKLSSQK